MQKLKMQSKAESLKESITNVVVGYIVAVISQILVFPLFGIKVGFIDNLYIGLYFTAISLARSYVIRRYFNNKWSKNA